MQKIHNDDIILLIERYAPREEVEVSLESKILDDLEYDSLSIIELFEEIDNRYGVDCMEDEKIYTALSTVEAFISLLKERVEERVEGEY